ncbi:MAG: DUF6913 domain-containing protein [Bacteroidia bacterium]
MSSFQHNIGKRILARHKQVGKSESLKPLSEVRTIGIIHKIGEHTKELNNVVHYFESVGKQVMTIGFMDQKELGEYSSNSKEVYITRKDLTFWKLPKKDVVSEFIAKEFDYLINLDVKDELVLQSISGYSKARIRVGKHSEEYSFCHDFMVGGDVKTTKELFNEIRKYIK